MLLDGSDVGIGGVDVEGFHIVDDNTILLAVSSAVTLGSLTVDPYDIVQFDATSLGPTTAGSFSLYFNGNDVGLSVSAEKIDGFTRLTDGGLLISTTGNPSVPGVSGNVSGKDEDLLLFTPTSLGTNTSGSWAMYFDGSDVGLADSSGEDVDGVAVGSNGSIYLTTFNLFAVPGVSGGDEDVFVCTPTSLGDNTACAYSPTLFFDGSAWGLDANDVDGLALPLG
jgi:hypothetical protein